MKIRLYGTVNDSIVDGPGLRYVIFTQGCLHHCPGCHNPDSHAIDGGYIEDTEQCLLEIDQNPLLDGVTLSGGEPFLQATALIHFVQKVKKRHLHVMIYSGYTFEEILELGDEEKKLLSLCDTLVDGKFILSLKSMELLYKGSSNQRIIDIQASLKTHMVIEQEINEYVEFVF